MVKSASNAVRKKTSKPNAESTITLIGRPAEPNAKSRGGATRDGPSSKAIAKLDSVATVATDKLAANLEAFTEKFGRLLSRVARHAGDYRLEEVKVTVELGVEGDVMLLGTGISASGSAGLELVFKIAADGDQEGKKR